jgi:23S rRNA (cytosine1962-C5)-methyltransferase
MKSSAPKTLRLRLRAAAETIVRGGHPWVFADSIKEQNREGVVGELAVIFDRNDQFLAVGLYDPDSPIRVRILHVGKPIQIDEAFWKTRFEKAIALRRGLFDERTNGYRCIHGENDGFPGLVVDRYADTFVAKIYTAPWLTRINEIAPLITALQECRCLVLRLSRNLRGEEKILAGPNVEEPVQFLENGMRFEADVLRGQKTGFFLDQRENRRIVETFAKGRDVLNAFSFSGGFSLYAARGGARSVVDVDISAHALASSRRNFALNNLGSARHETIQADTFEWLAQKSNRQFSLIILDPPSLAKRATDREGALRAYRQLAESAVPWLSKDGLLVAASCSAHVTPEEFFNALSSFAVRRQMRELRRTENPPDHPATFPEARYLKCIYLARGS